MDRSAREADKKYSGGQFRGTENKDKSDCEKFKVDYMTYDDRPFIG